ncbi:MAG: AraC family transcriptional regulator [Oscillospiraceae bacterium]|jgi:AraC family transcriptional regulator|nr:AraC family transcriptional regulator [Oscillospiraceae bacterium]
MDWVTGLQRALDFIELHLQGELDYDEIAAEAYVSGFHFQRVFSILCGFSLGEYIRSRRLTLAGAELAAGNAKVIDVALRYGYDSPDSFAKAFTRFHGVTPSAARKPGAALRSFGRLSISISLKGGNSMRYRIEERRAFSLVGYKRRFTGDPGARFEQECDFWMSTREEQEVLRSLRDTPEQDNIWHNVSKNFGDDGYDHYIAVTTGHEPPEGFERVEIPAGFYVVCETPPAKFSVELSTEVRRKMAEEWLPSSGYQFADAPELSVIYWFRKPNAERKYSELWMPIEKAE